MKWIRLLFVLIFVVVTDDVSVVLLIQAAVLCIPCKLQRKVGGNKVLK